MGNANKKLNRVVCIYGYDANDFAWRTITDKQVYHTSGTVVDFAGKNYILTTRAGLMSCQTIILYYTSHISANTIFRQNLTILYQSAWLNVVILGTKNLQYFDPTHSEIISSNTLDEPVTSFFDPDNLPNKNIPDKTKKYYMIKSDTDLSSEKVDFVHHVYDTNFDKCFVYDKTYAPQTIVYQFSLDQPRTKMVGICGAVVTGSRGKIVGIVSEKSGKKIYVIPVAILHMLLTQFISRTTNELVSFNEFGTLIVPFGYGINAKNNVVVDANYKLTTDNGIFTVKKRDRLASVDDRQIIVKKNQVWVTHENLGLIPLEIYFGLYLKIDQTTNIEFLRQGTPIRANFRAVSNRDYDIPLTDQPAFLPAHPIPFVNIKGIIMVELTHELIDIMARHKIIMDNNVVQEIMIGNCASITKLVVIIDCLDMKLVEKYKLPCISFYHEQIIQCPIVTNINNTNIQTLDDIDKINISAKIMKINLGSSFKNQQNIILFN